MTRLPAFLLVLLLALVGAGCGGSEPSFEEFDAQVRETRDRTDAALENVTTAEDWDGLLARLRAASAETGAAAEDLDELGAPGELEVEAVELVTALRGLSEELSATADALEEEDTFETQAISGLDFAFWDRAQNALTALRERGVEVSPLQRHQAPSR